MSVNDKKILSCYNVEKPIEGLIKRLNKCAYFSAVAIETVTDTKLLLIVYGLVAETGQYL